MFFALGMLFDETTTDETKKDGNFRGDKRGRGGRGVSYGGSLSHGSEHVGKGNG